MSDVPLVSLLFSAKTMLQESERELDSPVRNVPNLETITAWLWQAWGILRALEEYEGLGGEFSIKEKEKLKELAEHRESLVKELAGINVVPTITVRTGEGEQ